MASLLRTSLRASRISRIRIASPSLSAVPRRFASTDYGSKQSGQEQGINEPNPKQHLEHPGPETPATKAGSGTAPNSGPKDGAEPKISQGKSSAGTENDDVKKHNEEMSTRSEKSANQLEESDNKVDKKFWKGDVGDINKSNDS